jgi:Mn-dependent DtxR family transcriptional regulator
MREKQDDLLELLKDCALGKRNAVKQKDICTLLSCKGREVRNMVNSLRREGKPICSGGNGYWYAANSDEVLATIRYLDSRISNLSKAAIGLHGYLNIQ